ncbi:DNA-3-methyladenine glycosylase family protein [Halobacteriaceae archaeon GCM10025711]
METGTIPLSTVPGGFDLQSTLESGQTFRWRRDDGQTYDEPVAYGGDAWYASVVDGEVVRVRQVDDRLEWESTTDATPILRRQLRLDDDLDAILDAVPDDPLLDRAVDAFPGMHIVNDPFFPTLVSFICSAQMRVERIHRMQVDLAETYGDPVELDGRTYYGYPTPDRLAAATEADLRDLRLGYRAPYVKQSAELLASGEVTPEDVAGLPYEEAREALTAFVGVGDKVADCVLLFSLGYLEAVPLDTWIQQAIAEHYPDCDRGGYAETSRAIRERFGGRHAGYVQTYVFHYLRTGGTA